MPSSIQISSILIKSIIYSIAIHVIIFSLFIFVLPLNKEPHKPVLVFFGGILKGGELSDFIHKQSNQSGNLLTTEFHYKSSIPEAPYDNRSVNKPAYTEVTEGQAKITPKIIDQDVQEPGISDTPKQTEALVVPTMPKYKPLRFQTK